MKTRVKKSKETAPTREDVAYWAPYIGKEIWRIQYVPEESTCEHCGADSVLSVGKYEVGQFLLVGVTVQAGGAPVLHEPADLYLDRLRPVTPVMRWQAFLTEKEATAAAKKLNASRGYSR